MLAIAFSAHRREARKISRGKMLAPTGTLMGLLVRLSEASYGEQFEVAVINMALLLDRVRHAHRSPEFRAGTLPEELFEAVERIIGHGKGHSPALACLLEHWLQRSKRVVGEFAKRTT